ncbi:MAG: hypothetical protein ABSF14_22475, partial [Terriglobia bacterium]
MGKNKGLSSKMTRLRALMDLPLYRFLPRRGGLRLSAALLFTAHMVSNVGAQQPPPVPELQGPGKDVIIHSDTQQKDKDTYHLRGRVEVVYEDMHVHADEASFDMASGEVVARGHVVFDDPQSHLVADEVHYNV